MRLEPAVLRSLSSERGEGPRYMTAVLAGGRESAKFVRRRWIEVSRALPRGDAARMAGFVGELAERLEHGMHAPTAIVYDSAAGSERLFEIPRPASETLVVDASPYVRPLAALTQDYAEVGVVLLDHQHARIFDFTMGREELAKSMSKDIIGAHTKGGWSQRRFQRIREGAIDHFLKDVEEEVVRIFGEREPHLIVASGPHDALARVKELLPAHLRSKWVVDDSIHLCTPDNMVMREALRMAHEKEDTRGHELVDRLRIDILMHHPASFGGEQVQSSILEGRGEVLLVDDALKRPAAKCETCDRLLYPSVEACPTCGAASHQVDEAEELIELAERMKTAVEFVHGDAYLAQLGGVGLIHRY